MARTRVPHVHAPNKLGLAVVPAPGRPRAGGQKLLWPVMAITAIAPDVRINAREVPKPIRRRAYKLFEGDRNRSRTPEPVASLAKQEGTVQWKQTDQTNNR